MLREWAGACADPGESPESHTFIGYPIPGWNAAVQVLYRLLYQGDKKTEARRELF